jgi:hypothetical protein
MHRANEFRRSLHELFTGFEQRTADQQHYISTVEIKHFGNTFARHSAGWDRDAGSHSVAFVQGSAGNALAGI